MNRYAVLLAIVVMAALPSCGSPPPRPHTIVTGKVVYGNMAIEGAEIKVFQVESDRWKIVEESRSGYHGAFRLHLARGTYRIEASASLRSGDGAVRLGGSLEPFRVDGEKVRIDRVALELKRE